MHQGSIEKLKFDNRLSLRKGWLTKSERAAYLQSLPDVSDKISTPADEAEESAANASANSTEETVRDVPAFEVQTDRHESRSPQPEAQSGLLADPLSPPPFKEL